MMVYLRFQFSELKISNIFLSFMILLPDEDILNSIHRFRPKFLGTSDGLPSYYDPYEFEHICLLKCQQNGDTGALTADDAQFDPSHEAKKCFAVPFVASNNFQNNAVAKNFASIVKEVLSFAYTMCIILIQELIVPLLYHFEQMKLESSNQHIDYGSLVNHEASLCVYFVNGSCNRGSECLFSHSLQSKRSTCKFFLSLQVTCLQGFSKFHVAEMFICLFIIVIIVIFIIDRVVEMENHVSFLMMGVNVQHHLLTQL